MKIAVNASNAILMVDKRVCVYRIINDTRSPEVSAEGADEWFSR